jgi:uncharacterized protein DUF4381
MESDPLQQLRDVHLPPDPSWWPPAPGWWILAALAFALLAWSVAQLIAAYRRRAPIRLTKSMLEMLYADFQAGRIDAIAYMHQSNELIKRLLVRAYRRRAYAPLAGQTWLEALDQISGTRRFTDGPGRALGEARFSAHPDVDVAGLNNSLQLLLKKVKP